jgi:hypothetical protein
MQRKPLDRYQSIQATILTVLIVVFAMELYAFARVQDIWIDESCQLSGITVTMEKMLRWLTGQEELGIFGSQNDRMPPVSYILDWLWLRLAGPSQLGFRLLHATFVVVGVTVLALLSLRKVGLSAAIVLLLFLILSPKLILTGVEIRAYPIFFAVTCVQIAIFVRLVSCPKKVNLKLLAAFALMCLVADYTHFYGLVSTCAFFFALGVVFIRSPASMAVLIAVFAAVMIGSLGVLPFVSNAVSQSPPTAETGLTISRLLGYSLRLFGDTANLISDFAFVLFFAGTFTLFMAGVIVSILRVWTGRARPFDWLFLVIIAGVLAPVAASFFVRMNNVNLLRETYSSWLFAPLGLVIGIGATSYTGLRFWDHTGRFIAVGSMLIGAAWSTLILFAHSPIFIHGPQRFVGELYDRAIGPKAIIYEVGVGNNWIFPYFPLAFTYDDQIAQYKKDESGSGFIRIQRGAAQASFQDLSLVVAPYKSLLVIDVQFRTFRDLRCIEKLDLCPQLGGGPLEATLTGSGQWRVSKVQRSFEMFDTRVAVLERIEIGSRSAPKIDHAIALTCSFACCCAHPHAERRETYVPILISSHD